MSLQISTRCLVRDFRSLTLIKRFRRNPRIFPKAKSKIYDIREPTPIEPVENKLLKEWWTEYKLQMSSVIDAFKYEESVTATKSVTVSTESNEEVSLVELNESFNNESKRRGDEFWWQEAERLITERETWRQAFETKQKMRMQSFEDKLAKDTEESQHFVTLENLEQKIEEVLNSEPISFDFAIDEKGQKIVSKRQEVEDEEIYS